MKSRILILSIVLWTSFSLFAENTEKKGWKTVGDVFCALPDCGIMITDTSDIVFRTEKDTVTSRLCWIVKVPVRLGSLHADVALMTGKPEFPITLNSTFDVVTLSLSKESTDEHLIALYGFLTEKYGPFHQSEKFPDVIWWNNNGVKLFVVGTNTKNPTLFFIPEHKKSVLFGDV